MSHTLKDPPVTLAELAAALGRSPAYIKRYHHRMHERFGLPRKLAIGWLWPRLAIEAYLAGNDAPVSAVAIAANQNRALSARYAGGAKW